MISLFMARSSVVNHICPDAFLDHLQSKCEQFKVGSQGPGTRHWGRRWSWWGRNGALRADFVYPGNLVVT